MSKEMELKQKISALAVAAKTLYAEMEADEAKRTTDNREKLDKMIADGKNLRAEMELADDVKSLDDFVNAPVNESKTRFIDKIARKTYGEVIIDSDQFKNADRDRGHMSGVKVGNLITRLSRKGLYNTTDAQGGYAVRTDRETEILDIARQRPFTIMDLINVGQTSVDAVEYILMATRTNNAAVVPEWDADKTPGDGDYSNKFGDKPQGDLTLDLKTAVVKTIAEWIPASRQILSDAPNLRSMVDNELMYQVEYVLEQEIVQGGGSGNHFTGMLSTAGIQSRVHQVSGSRFSATDSIADTLRRAITDISLAFYEADGIILNPAEGEKLELSKDDDNNYINIYDPVRMAVWRKPVRESQATPAGTAIVGAFKMSAKLWDREQANIRVGEPGNFFLQNAVAVLAELRAAFAVTRPLGIEKVTGL